jgi:formamidopyrimidine-DNA glycosylase
MPEAPEVEAVVRTLRPFVRGKKIRRVHVRHAIAVRPLSTEAFKKFVEGARITEVERRGKYLLLPLDHGCLTLHFKFDGQPLWFDNPRDALARNIHVDVAFETDGGTLGFVDQRHLRRVKWLARPEDSAGICTLGVDAFSRNFTPQRISQICRASRQPLKILLIEQTRIAGLGNIYSSESLWHARLSPRRPSNRLTAQETHLLHKAVVSVLARALECWLHPAPDFRDPQWWFTGLESMLRVYDRESQLCTRCGARIRRIKQGGRSTYLCARCQR